ncbi:M10 family metallopeptidase [Kordiimonas aestuarii]|uniref:M10 family metallopeptidase n=1 Tax=Kordiimonas aestuarii TaxID=1005925 RepID=UPI0021D12094|nr:M10 family metallopeptidase [Kordiimonas aestuarii]
MADIPSNTNTTATLSFGGSYSGNIETVGDEDWIAVTLQAGTTYSIQMLGSTVGQGSLDDPFIKGLYDASGTSLNRYDDDGAGSRNSQLVFTPSESGTYYVSAGAWETETGSFTMTLSEYQAETPTVTSRAVVDQVDISGNDSLDSLLTLFRYQNVEGAETTHITFSIPDTGSSWSTDENGGYGAQSGDGEPWQDISYLTASEEALFRDALAQIESFAAVTFDEVTDAGNSAGTVRVAWTGIEDEGAAAWAYTPSGSVKAGDIWLLTDNQSSGGTGSYFHNVLLHELGHAVGLKHPFDEDGSGVVLSSEYDGNDYTIMSYNTVAGNENIIGASMNPTTYMYLDILALQHLYGAVEKDAGDTTYLFQFGNRYYETVWDTGGADTYDASGISSGVKLDLTPGSWSDVGTTVTLYGTTRNFTKTDTVYTPPEITIENAIGGNGRDELIGNDAANSLVGGRGEDTLSGGAGADTLAGGLADDTLTGGAGGDVFVFGENWDDDTIEDFVVGEDVIDLSGAGLSFSDLIIVEGSAYALVADGTGNTIKVMGVAVDALTAASFGDTAPEPAEPGSGNDILTGTSGADSIDALAGNDLVQAGAGNDSVTGGAGNDSVYGDEDNDFLRGGDGNDVVAGGDGNDEIYAGGDGDDTMRGDDGNDIVGGGSGDDIVIGDGADASVFTSSSLGASGADTLYGGTGDDTLVGSSWDDDGDGVVEAGEIVLASTDGRNVIWAGDGEDVLYGGDARDTLGGGVGNDAVYGHGGNDVIYGGKGAASVSADTLSGGSGSDNIFGGIGADSVMGDSGSDTLYGGDDNDVLDGGSGSDVLWGGAGDDTLTGDSGSDRFAFASGHGDDVVADFDTTLDTLGIGNTTTDFTSVAEVEAAASIATVGAESGVLINTGGGDSIFLVGLTVGDLSGIDYVF